MKSKLQAFPWLIIDLIRCNTTLTVIKNISNATVDYECKAHYTENYKSLTFEMYEVRTCFSLFS